MTLARYRSFAAGLLFSLMLAGCGGSGDSSSSGGGSSSGSSGSTTNEKVCTGDDLKGTWRVTVTVGDLSESDVVEFDGSESPGSNEFSETIEGVTLSGSIDPSCNSISGTATDGTLTGTFVAVKLS